MSTTNAVPQPVERLETTLRLWEDTLLIAQAELTVAASGGNPIAIENLKGSAINWDQLRKALLSRQPLNEDRFLTPDCVVRTHFMNSSILNSLPFMLHKWSMTSRRVYDLSPDFQRSLEVTSISKIAWEDVTEPFVTFGVSLPIPVPWDVAGAQGLIDFVFVEFSSAGVSFVGFGENFNGREFFTPEKKRRIMRAIRAKEIGTLRAILHGFTKENYAMPASHMVTLPMKSGPIVEELEDTNFDSTILGEATATEIGSTKLPGFWQLIIRTVIGLCLNLETFSKTRTAQDIQVDDWRKNKTARPSTVDNQAITDESMVCAVKLVGPLAKDEAEYHARIRTLGIKAATRELPAHFRRKHWRRRPGTGHDPLAPRTVKVSSSRVNSHRLPEHGLPAGSEVLVT